MNPSESVKNTKKAEYSRNYYQKNKERHLAYMKEKVKCNECENMIQRCYLSKHKRTNVCQRVADNNKQILEKALNLVKKLEESRSQVTVEDMKKMM